MEKIDEFASMFKRADRTPYNYEATALGRIIVVSDRDLSAAEQQREQLIAFDPRLLDVGDWQFVVGDDFHNVNELLDRLAPLDADLIVTQRQLDESERIPQHSLGVYVDVLTQTVTTPVLLLPGTAAHPQPLPAEGCRDVMVVTDHISGDSRLINWGACFCPDGGTLWLSHVEDDAIFERYMSVIERIPEIDSAAAREQIAGQLEKDARDFMNTCSARLHEERTEINLTVSIERGHHLREYRRLIESHGVDLAVANTKDDEQLAMHGMAYSLAVELADIPLLLL